MPDVTRFSSSGACKMLVVGMPEAKEVKEFRQACPQCNRPWGRLRLMSLPLGLGQLGRPLPDAIRLLR